MTFGNSMQRSPSNLLRYSGTPIRNPKHRQIQKVTSYHIAFASCWSRSVYRVSEQQALATCSSTCCSGMPHSKCWVKRWHPSYWMGNRRQNGPRLPSRHWVRRGSNRDSGNVFSCLKVFACSVFLARSDTTVISCSWTSWAPEHCDSVSMSLPTSCAPVRRQHSTQDKLFRARWSRPQRRKAIGWLSNKRRWLQTVSKRLRWRNRTRRRWPASQHPAFVH